MQPCEVAILGAGPYGLSAASYLRKLPGIQLRMFGEPMSFWKCHMPGKMLLRSPWLASFIADPDNRFTLETYRRMHQRDDLCYPISIADFISYAHWFQESIGVEAERRPVASIEPSEQGFNLRMEDGEIVPARRVVVAGGIQPFARVPKIFETLPKALVTHASEHREYDRFSGRQVLVIGAGQSALEAAAFLKEGGADVEVLIRNPELHWIGLKRRWLHSHWLKWALYGRGDVGPAGVSVAVQHPSLFRRLPRSLQERWGKRAVRAAVSERLIARTRGVTIHTSKYVDKTRIVRGKLQITLNDQTTREADHIVLGTGYQVDVRRYPFLSEEILRRLDLVNGYPRLDRGFQSSVPGLYFLGAPAAWSFGPLMRFVAGTYYASSAIQRSIANNRFRAA